MSNNNDAAADRIKAAALSATKGLSRAQAERAAAAAARNVNAYGQKEEGPSRWQERKEAKRQMYLMSTEKAVKLGERKDLKVSGGSTTASYAQCQKCFQAGHWTYECKNERVYMPRPSRSQLLKNPKLKSSIQVSFEGNPDYEKEQTREKENKKARSKNEDKGNKSRRKSKRKHRSSDTASEEDSSEASVFETDSKSSVTGSDDSSAESSSSYSSSDSEEQRRRRRRKHKKRRHHRRYTSSSDSSESESASDSDSYDKSSRRKSKRHSRKH
ncbi:Zinc finger CCHC-type protein [Dioscorea alata]|uniref:Zinc finger CCHC-type protein n=1 Tax=Dioscorea alata TaxID=55571 RepID=A0ACB7VUQ7_DIOAL|nr:Zinc finger CCHC-type protein [Dioscorea alata]